MNETLQQKTNKTIEQYLEEVVGMNKSELDRHWDNLNQNDRDVIAQCFIAIIFEKVLTK